MNRNRSFKLGLLAVLMSLPLASQADSPSNNYTTNTPIHHDSTPSTFTKISDDANDATIASEVRAKFESDPDIPMENLTVSSKKGVVTVKGHVKSKAQLEKIVNKAKTIDGVHTVDTTNVVVGSEAHH